MHIDNQTNTSLLTTKLVPSLFTEQKKIFVEKGDTPFTSQDTMKYFYFILKGKIKISQINEITAKEQTLQLLTRGDMFDLTTLLDGQYHEYIATALEKTELVEVPIEHVREWMKNDPEFIRFVFPYIAKQMRETENLAIDLSLYDVYDRILRLLSRNIEQNDKGVNLKRVDDLSHEELASVVGTVRKVLNRNLQKLKKKGVIDISRKKIVLKDLDTILKILES